MYASQLHLIAASMYPVAVQQSTYHTYRCSAALQNTGAFHEIGINPFALIMQALKS